MLTDEQIAEVDLRVQAQVSRYLARKFVDDTPPTDGQILVWGDEHKKLAFATPIVGSASFDTPTITLGTSAALGSGATVIHANAAIAAFDGTVPTTIAASDAAAVGSVAFAARRDHKHGAPATFAATPHTLLDGSVTSDSLAGSVTRGDVMVGNSTPKWARVAGTANAVLQFVTGGDTAWVTIPLLGGVKNTGGTQLVTLGTSAPHLTFGVSGSSHAIRLNDRVGVGAAAGANTVLNVGMPTGFTPAIQVNVAGTRTATGAGTSINGLVTMSTGIDLAGFAGTRLNAFDVLPSVTDPTTGGTLGEVAGFRMRAQTTGADTGCIPLWAWFSFPHPFTAEGIVTQVGFDFGDLDDGMANVGATAQIYGLRFGDRGGLDAQPFGQSAMSGGGTACPILQEKTSAEMLALAGLGTFYSIHAADFMFGANAAPSATVHVHQTTIGLEAHRIETAATNDDPRESVYQNRVATTDATVTTLHTFTVPATTTYFIEVSVVARRTGGTAGTAEDGAGYVIRGTYKNVAGTATLIGALALDYTAESVAGYDATLTLTGATVLCRVTGVADTNITWHLTARVRQIGT